MTKIKELESEVISALIKYSLHKIEEIESTKSLSEFYSLETIHEEYFLNLLKSFNIKDKATDLYALYEMILHKHEGILTAIEEDKSVRGFF